MATPPSTSPTSFRPKCGDTDLNTTVSDIARLVNGVVKGNGAAPIRGAAGLGEASLTDVTFVKAGPNPAMLKLLAETKAGAVLAPHGITVEGKTVIECADPLAAFAQILGLISKETQTRPDGIHATAVIHPTAKIGAEARIGAHSIVEAGAVIGDRACLMGQVYIGARSQVGEDTLLYPQVVLREDVSVGKRCIIHPGTVLGSDGYGYFFSNGRHNKIPQVGAVVIEDDVEIGANAAIDRAQTGATRIGRGTKLDNLVHIAHNVQLGPLCLITAQVGIAGSSTLGAGVILAGQTGIADHVKIGDGVKAGARTGVNRDVPAGQVIWGAPYQALNDELRQIALLRKLPELVKELKKVRERLEKNV